MKKNKVLGMYPGSFNPIHEGHIKIIQKALKLFDFLYIVVSYNPDKDNIDGIEKRYENVKLKLKHFKNVKVIINKDDFTANIAKKYNCNFIIRSGRNNEDFNYELELAAGNHKLNSNLETILIMPDYDDIKYSSTLERHRKKLNKNV